ncbi:MAG TPA: hypothetical protein VMW15_11340 [Terracidiphilus sp.]|nr:hypothetical protein [Terracidiphilus sp.]
MKRNKGQRGLNSQNDSINFLGTVFKDIFESLSSLVASLGTINSGGIDDGLVEFVHVGLCGCWVNGIWHSGGILDSSSGIRSAAAAKAVSRGEGSSRSGAGALIRAPIVW